MRAIVRIGFAVSKQATAVACAQSREQIIETDANESGPMNKVHNRAYALADSYVRHCESLMNARLRRDQVGHSIILKADNRVSKFADSRERLSRLGIAPFALEREWKSDEGDHQRACFAGRLGNVRCRTRTGAAAKP